MKAEFLKNAKYRKVYRNAGDVVTILEEDIDDLVEDGIIREDDIVEEEEQEKPLEQRSAAELKAYAAENNIDIGEAKRQKAILAAILAAGGNGDGKLPE